MKKFLKSVFALSLCLMMIAGIIPIGINSASAASNPTLVWPVPGHKSLSRGWETGHYAIDISDGDISGADIVAALGGEVVAKYTCTETHQNLGDCDGFGTGLIIKGTDGRWYQYAHMKANSIPSSIKVGSDIVIGQKIGKVGSTGYATGPHLHFEIDTTGKFSGQTNPKNESYVTTLKISYNTNGGKLKSSDYYLDGYKIFKTADNERYYQTWTYTTAKDTGLTNGNTFGMYKDGYTFLGWGLTKTYYTDTGKFFGDKDSTLIPSDFTANLTDAGNPVGMFAQWTPNILTVNYHSNYADKSFDGALNKVSADTDVVVYKYDFEYDKAYDKGLVNYVAEDSNCYLAKTGYTATGIWSTNPDGSGVSAGQKDSFTTGQDLAAHFKRDLTTGNATLDLYPVWTKDSDIYTVTLNANGGSVTTSEITVTDGETYGTLPEATMSGYSFAGWYTAAEGGTQVTGSTKVTGSVTLYAHWISNIHIHSFTSAVTPATCTAQGYTTYTCSCGYSYTGNVTEKTAHNYTLSSSVSATCTENGSKTYKCSVCGSTYSVTETATGHTPVSKESNRTEPTCTSEGGYTQTTTCSKCSLVIETDYDVLEPLGHIESAPVKENEIAATCTADGSYELATYCSRCNEITERETVVVPPTGHKDTNNDGRCDSCGTLLVTAKINVASARTVDYKSNVTIKATATDVPTGGRLIMVVNGNEITGSNTEVTYNAGQITSDVSYTVKAVDASGNILKDASGNDLVKEGGKISVNASFFAKIIAFFKGLFGALPSVTVQP